MHGLGFTALYDHNLTVLPKASACLGGVAHLHMGVVEAPLCNSIVSRKPGDTSFRGIAVCKYRYINQL
jgi:hypothetical protein